MLEINDNDINTWADSTLLKGPQLAFFHFTEQNLKCSGMCFVKCHIFNVSDTHVSFYWSVKYLCFVEYHNILLACIMNVRMLCIHYRSSDNTFILISYIPVEFLSVSDLLDYIIPNHDAKGRGASVKRRNHITKVWCRFTNLNNLNSLVWNLDKKQL